MKLEDLDFPLPDHLIAQAPLPERDGARLLVVEPTPLDRRVRDLPSLLPPSLIVVNNTRVLPARLFGQKTTGGKLELLLIERLRSSPQEERWHAMGKASKSLRAGTSFRVGDLDGEVAARREDGTLEVLLRGDDVPAAIARAGEMPLPPYIRRPASEADRERYQTVFASEPGAVAAPTAGLHFSKELVAALEDAGHRFARVTLHVGPGTFRPVKTDSLDDHLMHEERFEIGENCADAIAEARAEGRTIWAIGTTVVRTLESAANDDGTVRPGSARTSLFIRPPYTPKVVDHLMTNFHLPRSTLLALVMAFGGVEVVRNAYRHAVDAKYRFFSYGDAMLLRNLRVR
ncbi:MAG: tRNA preQ1(34) S-adenosylmethionine ribosyltransferase-isomerase QueA [Myxococcota bacterium]